jgi:hypothetical protein
MNDCPKAAYGFHGRANKDGKCPYCHREIDPPVQPPRPRKIVSESEHFYRTMWDPDYDGLFHDEWRY